MWSSRTHLFVTTTVNSYTGHELQYCPAALGWPFVPKLYLKQNSCFKIISNLGICRSSVHLKISYKTERDFWNIKTYRKFKYHGVRAELETKICYGQNIVDKFLNLSKIDGSLECFTADFSQFFSTNIKIWLLGGWLVTIHQFQAFKGFSWNFLIS